MNVFIVIYIFICIIELTISANKYKNRLWKCLISFLRILYFSLTLQISELASILWSVESKHSQEIAENDLNLSKKESEIIALRDEMVNNIYFL